MTRGEAIGTVARRRSRPEGQATPAAAEAAAEAGLRYVCDQTPGLRRVRAGKGFRYVGPDGKRVRNADVLRRIQSLAIPPAWADVWICPDPDGHLQATGRDEKGRKQHRYHPRWRNVRDAAKYGRLLAFGRALPRLRERVEQDLSRPGLARDKVLAAVIRLLEITLIRVGNEDYARTNKSYGLTTLQDRHAQVAGPDVRFRFRGKSGIWHEVAVRDRRLARIVKQCQELPGQDLFQYLDADGVKHDVTSADVNRYLREAAGQDFSAKDFRTWFGTVLAARALREFEEVDSAAQAKRNVMQAIEKVAKQLGNTKTICRKCYVHPAVVDAYLDGSLVATLTRHVDRKLARELSRLEPEEAAVLAFLHEWLERERPQKRKRVS